MEIKNSVVGIFVTERNAKQAFDELWREDFDCTMLQGDRTADALRDFGVLSEEVEAFAGEAVLGFILVAVRAGEKPRKAASIIRHCGGVTRLTQTV